VEGGGGGGKKTILGYETSGPVKEYSCEFLPGATEKGEEGDLRGGGEKGWDLREKTGGKEQRFSRGTCDRAGVEKLKGKEGATGLLIKG